MRRVPVAGRDPVGAAQAGAQAGAWPGPAGGPDGLVEAAIGGDTRAVEELLGMVRRLAWRYCRARLVRAEQAEERAGEICRAVFQALPGYRDQGEPFLAFVYGIAAGKVADARHRTARRRPAAPPGMLPERDYPVGETHGRRIGAAAAELPARLARGLEALPEQQREVLVLRVALGLSIAETATALGISPEAVRIAGHRGLSALRAHPARGLLGEHPGAGGDMPGRERAAETTTPRIPTRTSPP